MIHPIKQAFTSTRSLPTPVNLKHIFQADFQPANSSQVTSPPPLPNSSIQTRKQTSILDFIPRTIKRLQNPAPDPIMFPVAGPKRHAGHTKNKIRQLILSYNHSLTIPQPIATFNTKFSPSS
jgi:hypothetical protein